MGWRLLLAVITWTVYTVWSSDDPEACQRKEREMNRTLMLLLACGLGSGINSLISLEVRR